MNICDLACSHGDNQCERILEKKNNARLKKFLINLPYWAAQACRESLSHLQNETKWELKTNSVLKKFLKKVREKKQRKIREWGRGTTRDTFILSIKCGTEDGTYTNRVLINERLHEYTQVVSWKQEYKKALEGNHSRPLCIWLRIE